MSDFAAIEQYANAILIKAQQVAAKVALLQARVISQDRIDAVDSKLAQTDTILMSVSGALPDSGPPPPPTGPPA